MSLIILTNHYASLKLARAMTLAIIMGGTIWGCHFDQGAKPTIGTTEVFHYSITFCLKSGKKLKKMK